jgi:carboxymethylenebutenolidase
MGQWIDLHTAHGGIAAWRAEPAGEPRGAIVVIQEIFGVNPHIRSVAADFAGEGYVALAPAFFDVLERGVELDYDAEGIARGRGLITALGLEKAVDIVDAAAGSLSAIGPVGTVGYCWGGTVALLAALRLGLPSASYYGARDVPFLEETAKAPVIFHFGERDKSIPPEMVQQHRDALPRMPLYTYPADHGFNCDARASYDPASAKLARERTLAFFAEHLAKA